MNITRPRRRLSPEKLSHGVDGTRYGFGQMLLAGAVLSSVPMAFSGPLAEPLKQVTNNALIESFLANARRIGWFLDGAKRGDAYAGDYLPEGAWTGWPAARPVVSLVSDALSHAKYLPKPAPYRWGDLIEPLVDGMRCFVTTLDETHSPWHRSFAETVAELDEWLPLIMNGDT